MSGSLWPYGLEHASPFCPLLFPRVCSDSCPLSQWYHPTISSSVIPFSSCPQSFPASGSFPMSWLFASGGQSIGASIFGIISIIFNHWKESIFPMIIQGWFLLRLTGWISLQSKGPSRVFSSTIVWKHQFSSTQPSLWSSTHICTRLPEKPWLWLYRCLLAK